MLREIRDLGFEFAELSHGTRISLLPGILEAVDAGEIKISSVHNFCPLPMGVNNSAPNLYQFSAERDRERDLAKRYTIKTLETAARVKAPLVVLHLGSIDLKNNTDKLLEMVQRGEKESPKYARLCAEVDERRESRKGPFSNGPKNCLSSWSLKRSRAVSLWERRTVKRWKSCPLRAISTFYSGKSTARI